MDDFINHHYLKIKCMNEQSPSVVLIPGFMLNESLWDEVIQNFPHHWNIYRASLRQGHTIEEIAENIVKNAPPKFVLIGFSLGGYIARSLISRFPKKISALILIASSLRDDSDEQKKRKLRAINSNSKKHFRGLSRIAITKTLHPSQAKNDFLIQRIQKMGNEMGYEAFVTLSLLERNITQSTTIKCPTLIISGAQDTLRSKEEAIELVNLIPKSDFDVIDNTGHMIPLEQPEKLTISILKWLKKVDLK